MRVCGQLCFGQRDVCSSKLLAKCDSQTFVNGCPSTQIGQRKSIRSVPSIRCPEEGEQCAIGRNWEFSTIGESPSTGSERPAKLTNLANESVSSAASGWECSIEVDNVVDAQ